MSNSSHDYYSSIPTKRDGLGEVNDIRKLIEEQFEQLKGFEFGVISKEQKLGIVGKTELLAKKHIWDIIILEGTRIITVQPGLITIGRSNLWKRGKPTSQIKDLEQVVRILHGAVVGIQWSFIQNFSAWEIKYHCGLWMSCGWMKCSHECQWMIRCARLVEINNFSHKPTNFAI